jgi:hypothetical protein
MSLRAEAWMLPALSLFGVQGDHLVELALKLAQT